MDVHVVGLCVCSGMGGQEEDLISSILEVTPECLSLSTLA